MKTTIKLGITMLLAVSVILTNVFIGFIMSAIDPNQQYKDEEDYKYLFINVAMWLAVMLTLVCLVIISFSTYYDVPLQQTVLDFVILMKSNVDATLLLSFTMALTMIFGVGMYLIEGKYIDYIVFILGFPFSEFGALKLRRRPKSYKFTQKMIEAFNLFALLTFSVVLFFYTW
jgi:hypothetical protein